MPSCEVRRSSPLRSRTKTYCSLTPRHLQGGGEKFQCARAHRNNQHLSFIVQVKVLTDYTLGRPRENGSTAMSLVETRGRGIFRTIRTSSSCKLFTSIATLHHLHRSHKDLSTLARNSDTQNYFNRLSVVHCSLFVSLLLYFLRLGSCFLILFSSAKYHSTHIRPIVEHSTYLYHRSPCSTRFPCCFAFLDVIGLYVCSLISGTGTGPWDGSRQTGRQAGILRTRRWSEAQAHTTEPGQERRDGTS